MKKKNKKNVVRNTDQPDTRCTDKRLNFLVNFLVALPDRRTEQVLDFVIRFQDILPDDEEALQNIFKSLQILKANIPPIVPVRNIVQRTTQKEKRNKVLS